MPAPQVELSSARGHLRGPDSCRPAQGSQVAARNRRWRLASGGGTSTSTATIMLYTGMRLDVLVDAGARRTGHQQSCVRPNSLRVPPGAGEGLGGYSEPDSGCFRLPSATRNAYVLGEGVRGLDCFRRAH